MEIKLRNDGKQNPIGEPITLITSNMPDDLNTIIIKLISEYCGQ
jgi:hypothetical protein